MRLELLGSGNQTVAEIISDDIVIREPQDALDLMADAGYQGAGRIIIYEWNLAPGFFDLKTGIAGEILQKFTNYRVQLAIIGDFSKYSSKSLRDFIYESNKHGRLIFTATREEALEKVRR